ncbi:MAG: hypothetical protein C0514_03970 [Candidatus Puniceispirillum sp.]|nr:hypothetical protein [Candidatus Puniceispirillum sp.]
MSLSFTVLLGLSVLTLLVISAIFSACETAFVGASKARIHAQARKGNKKAKMLQTLLVKLESLVGTILLCNTFTNALLTILMATFLEGVFGDNFADLITPFVITPLLVIYAEVMPKLIAINRGDSVMQSMVSPISFLVKWIAPLTRLIEVIAKRTLNLVGVRIDPQTHLTSAMEELRGAIDLLGEGAPLREENAMLHSILDLHDVDVDEIMIHRKSVSMLDASMPVDALFDKVVKSPYTRFPVWRGNPDNIIGILHTKDLLRAYHRGDTHKEGFRLDKILTKPWFIPDTAPLKAQLQAFRTKKEHFALVVDEYGAFLGIVTLEDVMEEIVGEILDEHDEPLAGIAKTAGGDLLINGKMTIRDLNRQFSWDLPDEEASTLAGLVIHESRTIPKEGQVFQLAGLRITVVKRHKNQIVLLRVTPLV